MDREADILPSNAELGHYDRLDMLAETTNLFPANIAAAIFVHLLRDPINGRPRAWGVHRLAQGAPPEAPRCWIAASAAEEPACQLALIETLRGWWQEAIAADQGPHLLTFGTGSLRMLRETLRDASESTALDFLWIPERQTDLRQLLIRHFALPIPLGATLRTAAQAWGLCPTMASPQDLLQEGEEEAELLLHDHLAAAQVAQIQAYLQTHLVLQQRLWQACVASLRSDWQQYGRDDGAPDPDRALFTQVPHSDTALQANYGFKAYYHLCREQGALFVWPHAALPTAPLSPPG